MTRCTTPFLTLVLAGQTGCVLGETNLDRDGDGFERSEDCDDTDAGVHPDADEICDGIDNDCSGQIDDHPIDGTARYTDEDGDGHGVEPTFLACTSAEGAFLVGDCDDTDPTVHPGASDADCDGIDNDCDGVADGDRRYSGFVDADGDGHGDPSLPTEACDPTTIAPTGDDCDDTRSTVNPSAPEVCGNDTDDDCDGSYGTACGISGSASAPYTLPVEDCDALTDCMSVDVPGGVASTRRPVVGYDLDRDGTDELLLGDKIHPSNPVGSVFVVWETADWDASSDAILALAIQTDAAATSTHKALGEDLVVLDDFTGDGWPNLVVQARQGFWLVSSALAATEDTVTIDTIAWDLSDGGSTTALASVGDVTGDGRTDLIGFHNGNSFYILAGTPEFLSGAPRSHTTFDWFWPDASGDRGAFGGNDLDGDGFGEVFISEPNSGSNGEIRFMNGSDLVAASETGQDDVESTPIQLPSRDFGSFGRQFSTDGDLNHDGYTDLVISSFDRTTGQPATFLVLGATETFSSVSFAMYVDGSAEVTFANPATTGTTITDLLSPGDLTGDGVDDLAVLHEADESGSFVDLYAGSLDGFDTTPIATIQAPDGQSFVTGGAATLDQPGAPLLALTTTAGTLIAVPLAGY